MFARPRSAERAVACTSRASGDTQQAMSHENVEIVRRMLHAFSEGDVEGALEHMASEVEWRPALLGGGLLEGAVYRGHAGMREFFRVQGETWETVKALPRETRDRGDLVFVEVELQAVGRASGVAVNERTWNVIEVRDRKMISGRVFVNKADALVAAGLSE
jgi:ketosteroid isomerase-like protein